VLVTRGEAAAPDTTARLVPPNALLYAHLSTSEARTQDAALQALASRFTTLRTQLPALAMAFTPAAGELDFARDVRPWLGDDAALALIPDGDASRPLLVASVRDSGKAVAALRRLGARSAGEHKGTQLLTMPPRTWAALAGEHLVVGPEDAVRGAIDRAAATGVPSLADGRAFRRAASDREGAASAEVFAPAAGLRRLLDGRTGIAGVLRQLAASPQLDGVAAQIAAEESGVRVSARVIRAGGATRRATFSPRLIDHAPDDAAAHLSLPGLAAAADLFSRAGGADIVDSLREALPQAAGMELDDALEPFGGEAALTVTAGEQAPVFSLASRTGDERRARDVLARVQEPVSAQLAGGTPFAPRKLAGADAFTLDVTPELQPSYAMSDGTTVAATQPSGLGQLRHAKAPLEENSTFEQVKPAEGARVEALGFLDPRQLLALGERSGLPALGSPALRDDLRRIRSAAAAVVEDANHPSDTTAELYLEIP
jgi:hypothetical protein